MLRVKHNTAGKTWGCNFCADPILPGQAVQMITPFRRPAIRRHATCPRWRNSELETSEGKAQAWRVVEGVEDALGQYRGQVGTFHDFVSAVEDGANELREAAEIHREAVSNLEGGGFVGTAQIDEFNEWADSYDDWADQWESHVSDIDPHIAEEEETEAWIGEIESLIGEVDPG